MNAGRARTAGPWAAVLALLLWLVAAASPALADPTFPPLTGRVVDDAHVLSAQTVSDLTGKLADLEAKTGRQLVVVTLPSLQGYAIEDYGYQLGRAWGIGQKGQDNGVIFIVVPSEHKVRLEVGYGLEPVLTDALSSVILQEQVLPRFRNGDVDGGVAAGTNAIITQLSLDDATAKANVANAQQQQPPAAAGPSFGAIFGLIVIFLIFSLVFRGGGLGWMLPMAILSSGSRRDGGGWGGGGFGGGGGFSGGGGSFGGGGASGSW